MTEKNWDVQATVGNLSTDCHLVARSQTTTVSHRELVWPTFDDTGNNFFKAKLKTLAGMLNFSFNCHFLLDRIVFSVLGFITEQCIKMLSLSKLFSKGERLKLKGE